MKKIAVIFSAILGSFNFTNAQCPIVNCQTPLTLSCNAGPISFSATSNYSANITSWWLGPSGEPIQSSGTATSFISLNNPGKYTVLFKDNTSNCITTETVLISPGVGVVSFSISATNGFTTQCTSSLFSGAISSVVTSPNLNLPVEYAYGLASVTPIAYTPNPTFFFGSCGNYYLLVRDQTNLCASSTTITINCGTVVPSPVLISGSNTVCLGSSVTYSASGASTYSWTNGPTTSTYNVIPNSNTNYFVTGTDANGCISSNSISLTTNSNCSQVWPGDANSDGIVNNLDPFEIGLAMNQAGPARTPTSNVFASQYASVWGGTVSTGKNLCHADCNGDGIIDNSDNIAISSNFALTHAFKQNNLYAQNADLTIVPTQSVGYINGWNTAEIFLGSNTNNISQLYGAAFEINLDTAFIENGSYFNFGLSFLNSSNQNITFNKLIFTNQKHYITNVRTDGMNAAGNGKIGEIVYKIKSNVSQNSILNLSISNGIRINNAGISSTLSVGSNTLLLIEDPNGLEELSYFNQATSIYPNPCNEKINIRSLNDQNVAYVIYDLMGRKLLEGKFQDTITIDLSAFRNGTYIIKLSTDKNSIYRKFILNQ